MKKYIKPLLITLIISLFFCTTAWSFSAQKHNSHLKQIFLGQDVSSVSPAIADLENASHLAIDQYNEDGNRHLSDLKKNVKGIPKTISDIDFSNNLKHRNYTHRGWENSYYTPEELETSHWEQRKEILKKTVQHYLVKDNKKSEAFCKLIYCTHILEDYIYDRQKSEEKYSNLLANYNFNTYKISKNNISENKEYIHVDDVAPYIHKYRHLPSNYINKEEAEKINLTKGSNPDKKIIGGDDFFNLEKRLPLTNNKYYECDIDYENGPRNSKRLVYTQDGKNIYYTIDHYESFFLIYTDVTAIFPKTELFPIAGENRQAHPFDPDKQPDIASELLAALEILFPNQKYQAPYMALTRELRTINLKASTLLHTNGGLDTYDDYIEYYTYAEQILESMTRNLPKLLDNEYDLDKAA